jgi:hypothetical protein
LAGAQHIVRRQPSREPPRHTADVHRPTDGDWPPVREVIELTFFVNEYGKRLLSSWRYPPVLDANFEDLFKDAVLRVQFPPVSELRVRAPCSQTAGDVWPRLRWKMGPWKRAHGQSLGGIWRVHRWMVPDSSEMVLGGLYGHLTSHVLALNYQPDCAASVTSVMLLDTLCKVGIQEFIAAGQSILGTGSLTITAAAAVSLSTSPTNVSLLASVAGALEDRV